MSNKILIIDDDELVRSMMANFLKKNGYAVAQASNGNEGIEIAKKNIPDIVITDMLMPEKEGIETIVDLKKYNTDIKIIAISSGGKTKNMSFLDIAKNVGAQATIEKPFKPQDLIETIKEVIT